LSGPAINCADVGPSNDWATQIGNRSEIKAAIMKKVRLVVPVFNDWPAFSIFLRELNRAASTFSVRIAVSAVNDGSTDAPTFSPDYLLNLNNLESVEIIHLSVNVGHQRAIAIGLCVAVEDDDCDAVLIMDADGEDSPDVIEKLMQAAEGRSDYCVVAQRRKRSENLTFKLSYLVYKFIFKLLTARQINFGNFSLLSRSYARRLVKIADLWNNLPAAILRSKLPFKSVPVDRAQRYTGKSKMNFTSLIVHGLSGISVYAEVIFVRLILLTVALACLSGFSVVAVFILRLYFPWLATPGWATTVSFGMLIILVQVLSVTLSSILMLLNSRVQRLIIPIVDYKVYVDFRQPLIGPGVEMDAIGALTNRLEEKAI
jgi:glycosyltransferase involved in cell wall biosynthesis